MLTKIRAAIAVSLASFGTVSDAEAGRAADCLLIVGGQEAIRGECLFSPMGADGSFSITAYNGRFFAYVQIEASLARWRWPKTAIWRPG